MSVMWWSCSMFCFLFLVDTFPPPSSRSIMVLCFAVDRNIVENISKTAGLTVVRKVRVRTINSMEQSSS
jgi:hypothetical protein